MRRSVAPVLVLGRGRIVNVYEKGIVAKGLDVGRYAEGVEMHHVGSELFRDLAQ